MLTLGSGIGSAVFLDGRLLPNTELGTIKMHGMKAEEYAAAAVIDQDELTIEEWAARLQEYLDEVEYLLSPQHLILGGGISADYEQFFPLLHTRATLRPAHYRNQAGAIGAALYAREHMRVTNRGKICYITVDENDPQ
jgi:polyphosphate glucokinase